VIELQPDGTIILANFPVWDGTDGFEFRDVTIRYPRGKHYRAARNHADRIRVTTAEYGAQLAEARTPDGKADPTQINELNTIIQTYLDEAVPKWLCELLRASSDATIPPDDRADDWREEFPPYAYEYRFTQTVLQHWRSSPFGSST